MKHIKTFENKYRGCYWIIPTDKRMRKALQQINCDNYYIDDMMNNSNVDPYQYIFIKKDYTQSRPWKWGWNPVLNQIRDIYYENSNYEFKGVIMSTEEEIELEQNIKKYNL